MHPKGVVALAVLTCGLVTGGWYLQQGLQAEAAVAAPVDGARLLDQVMTRVREDYVDSVSANELILKSVEGVIDELGDPHSVYLSPERLARLSEATAGRYAGVGIQIDVRDGWITVVAPIPQSPAATAGIQTGDRIVEVDGKQTSGWTGEEAQRALRGAAGSAVRVTLERPGSAVRIPVTLQRRQIRIRPVEHALMIGDGIGYADLSTFSDDAAVDLGRAVDSLVRQGARSMVLDLRGDPGGLLDEGVAVGDLFLDRGKRIVEMKGRTADVNRTFEDAASERWPQLVLAVLVDSGSASASEIVAGALQDHDRALVLGTPTFGKGSAQSLFPVAGGGGVKLTVARWFTPSGRSITRLPDTTTTTRPDTTRPKFTTASGRTVFGGGGIIPDVIVRDSARTASNRALAGAIGARAPILLDVLTAYGLSMRGNPAVRDPGFLVTAPMRAAVYERLAVRGVKLDTVAIRAALPALDALIGQHVARYALGADAEFRRGLRNDPMVARVLSLLAGARTQGELLAGAR